MEFTQQDREALYQVWMSQKAKMRMTQMEITKRLGISQIEFSELLRGSAKLEPAFVEKFCAHLHVDAKAIIPSLKEISATESHVVYLQSRITVDGEIKRTYVDGNQVVVEYAHTLND
ncbi:putative transcriptional regulator [Vibrio nigripulchritudo SOn1]|uniref:Transcriptional regulator n=1 Tax=Vibrio nigripulchritudo SOn1 TaxID=1238450 RepID=A0AAV2VLK2_9VIBR|nr:transcriptional regulator [Vibrio nigripulchritudo]CCO45572.1 putative transcriptional regulator [Vibrio nigripulchritudo SOn1]